MATYSSWPHRRLRGELSVLGHQGTHLPHGEGWQGWIEAECMEVKLQKVCLGANVKDKAGLGGIYADRQYFQVAISKRSS